EHKLRNATQEIAAIVVKTDSDRHAAAGDRIAQTNMVVVQFLLDHLEICDELHTQILFGACAAVLAQRNGALQVKVASAFIKLLKTTPVFYARYLSPLVYSCNALKMLVPSGSYHSHRSGHRMRAMFELMR